jgi:hypothetical protein
MTCNRRRQKRYHGYVKDSGFSYPGKFDNFVSKANKVRSERSERQKMFDKEKKEHPTLSDAEIEQIVRDHMNKK